ncbi:MAG: sensor histidine kinase [Chitinophagaceae bacterium]
MKKYGLHILFWLAYLAEDTLLAYWWDSARLKAMPPLERVIFSLKLCAALLPPKILFTYLLLYVILDRVLQQKGRTFINIIGLVAAIMGTMILLRLVDLNFVYPYIYHQPVIPAFFNPFGMLFNLIDIGFVSGIAVAIRQLRLQFEGREREKLLTKEKLQAELKFLKNQTNPHFLFNTLNNIYALARKKSDGTADAVMKLSKILRFMLYESGNKFISLEEEIKLIDDYIDLEKIRYNNLNIQFQKDIDDPKQPLSPLLLLPLVENAFKHGASESFNDAYVKISAKLRQAQLIFTVENSKEETQAKAESEKQIGLTNTRRQLELMYKDYDLNVENLPNKFSVTLHVNLNQHGEI